MREAKAPSPLYETDFALWLDAQGRALHEGRLCDLDIPYLIEEIEGLGINQRHELASRIRVVLVHMLKNAYQPHRASRSWRITLLEQRDELALLFRESPSLRRLVPQAINTPTHARAGQLRSKRSFRSNDFPQSVLFTSPTYWRRRKERSSERSRHSMSAPAFKSERQSL